MSKKKRADDDSFAQFAGKPNVPKKRPWNDEIKPGVGGANSAPIETVTKKPQETAKETHSKPTDHHAFIKRWRSMPSRFELPERALIEELHQTYPGLNVELLYHELVRLESSHPSPFEALREWAVKQSR